MHHVYARLTSIWLMSFVWSVCRSTGNEQFKFPLPLSSQLVPCPFPWSNYENTDVRKKIPWTAAIKCEQNKHDTMHRHNDTQNTDLITPPEHFGMHVCYAILFIFCFSWETELRLCMFVGNSSSSEKRKGHYSTRTRRVKYLALLCVTSPWRRGIRSQREEIQNTMT